MAAPRPGGRSHLLIHRSCVPSRRVAIHEDAMSSSPRTRPTPGTVITVSAVVLLVAVLAAATVLGFDLAGAAQGFVTGLYPPAAVTEQGAQIRDLYTIVFLIAVVIFFLVEGLIVWSVIRYRRKPGDDTLPAQTHGNNLAEALWTIVPSIIVVFLFVVSWQTLSAVDTAAANPETRIRAVAGQFQWQFDYLDTNGQTVLYTQVQATGDGGGMVVPAGRTVQLSLSSQDVIHAFYVPQFLFKRDVVPGRVNKFDFKVNAADAGQTFRGQCAELCGTGHRIMLFEVHAMTPADFDAWLKDRIAEASATPPPPPSGGPAAGPPLQLSALNVAFEQTSLAAPAGKPFQIAFDNKDASVPHNVAIHDAAGAEVFKGAIFPGPAQQVYDVPALDAGTYAFACTVHPTMTGTLTAQ
jgi:cytochrome c oxidase subunit 2